MSSRLFPLFLDIAERDVLVVGGGAVAHRKAEAFLRAGARVRVGAPVLTASLSALRDAGRVEHLVGEFESRWLDGAWLVIAATDDGGINRAVAEAARQRRIFVNVVDDAELSSLHVPAVVERGPLKIAISSGGGAPMLARHLREWLEATLDERWAALAEFFLEQRQRIRQRLPDLAQRRRWFAALWSDQDWGRVRPIAVQDLEASLLGVCAGASRRDVSGASLLGDRARASRREASGASLLGGGAGASRRGASGTSLPRVSATSSSKATIGRVLLVGAGPGDPGLLTLRGLRALNEADVILHDRLVSEAVLRMARRDAERVDVGKVVGGDHHSTQALIHDLMIEHARAGKTVVRLKGGDPFVFGRGGEELEALRAAGIAFEVVPGITAALACAAYAGIPLTHRDHAQSLRLVTAHCASDDATDNATPGSAHETWVIYMGVGALEATRARLLASGHPPGTPFALIENGSRPEQRVIVGTLTQLVERAEEHRVKAPALLIVGEVAALATRLHWFGAPPLGAGCGTTQTALAEAA